MTGADLPNATAIGNPTYPNPTTRNLPLHLLGRITPLVSHSHHPINVEKRMAEYRQSVNDFQ
ncbi:MAG: hypothetical protein U0236_23050 [Nitrospira sp.]